MKPLRLLIFNASISSATSCFSFSVRRARETADYLCSRTLYPTFGHHRKALTSAISCILLMVLPDEHNRRRRSADTPLSHFSNGTISVTADDDQLNALMTNDDSVVSLDMNFKDDSSIHVIIGSVKAVPGTVANGLHRRRRDVGSELRSVDITFDVTEECEDCGLVGEYIHENMDSPVLIRIARAPQKKKPPKKAPKPLPSPSKKATTTTVKTTTKPSTTTTTTPTTTTRSTTAKSATPSTAVTTTTKVAMTTTLKTTTVGTTTKKPTVSTASPAVAGQSTTSKTNNTKKSTKSTTAAPTINHDPTPDTSAPLESPGNEKEIKEEKKEKETEEAVGSTKAHKTETNQMETKTTTRPSPPVKAPKNQHQNPSTEMHSQTKKTQHLDRNPKAFAPGKGISIPVPSVPSVPSFSPFNLALQILGGIVSVAFLILAYFCKWFSLIKKFFGTCWSRATPIDRKSSAHAKCTDQTTEL